MEDWHFHHIDEEFEDLTARYVASCDSLLMGRATYDNFAVVWPGRTGVIADKINSMRKYVASHTLQKADWTNSRIISGDLVKEVAEIKQQPGEDILMYGFGPVARTLLQHGLLDELRLWAHPVLAGTGGPGDLLFRNGTTAELKLVNTHPLRSGIVVRYQPTDRDDAPAS
jgi:dihydrofolate reductase